MLFYSSQINNKGRIVTHPQEFELQMVQIVTDRYLIHVTKIYGVSIVEDIIYIRKGFAIVILAGYIDYFGPDSRRPVIVFAAEPSKVRLIQSSAIRIVAREDMGGVLH